MKKRKINLLKLIYLDRLNFLHIAETGYPLPLYDVYAAQYKNKKKLKKK